MKDNKKFKPVWTIDITGITDVNDIINEIVYAKVNNNIAISNAELNDIINNTIDLTVLTLFGGHNAVVKMPDGRIITTDMYEYSIDNSEEVVIDGGSPKIRKKNIFRRFWNWITRKNKK